MPLSPDEDQTPLSLDSETGSDEIDLERVLPTSVLDGASERSGRALGDALKAEARRRADSGEFFGHIAYASVIARKPA